MEELVLLPAFALVAWLTVVAARRSRASGAPGWLWQALVGVACGIVGAAVVAVPYADVVPDRFETHVNVGVLAVCVLAVLVVIVRRVRARRPRRGRHARTGPPPRPRVPTGPPRHAASR